MKNQKLNLMGIGYKLTICVMRWLRDENDFTAPVVELKLKMAKELSQILAGDPELLEQVNEKYGNTTKWFAYVKFISSWFGWAGFISKVRDEQGYVWRLESKGLEMLESEKQEEEIIAFVNKAYYERRKLAKSAPATPEVQQLQSLSDTFSEATEDSEEDENLPLIVLAADRATKEIKSHIAGINPHLFQKVVAALLRAMGYHIDYVSPEGPDGGVDIVAYDYPLGAKSPRIKVQVKRFTARAVDVGTVRELHGVLKHGDIGMIVCSSSFTSAAEKFAREAEKHIRLISGSDFINLWCEHYPSIEESERNRIPLKQIYLLDAEGVTYE